jgi:ABC-type uncharacterized transport system substrate-binding protein
VAARGGGAAAGDAEFVDTASANAVSRYVAVFRKGLDETGYIDGQNVTVEYHWLEGQYDRLPALMADLVRRRVAVIVTPDANATSIAAKRATATIPIVFGVFEDPVELGLVASLARPGGNATGINLFNAEVVAKRLGLLHELAPEAVRVAVLVNPANRPNAEARLQEVSGAARAMGMQIRTLNASTIGEIEAAFAGLSRERPDALFVTPDTFLFSRRVGLDVSQEMTHLCVIGGDAKIVWQGKCLSTPEAIAETIRSRAPDVVRVGLESGPLSTWHWHALKAMGLPVVCLDSRHAQATMSGQVSGAGWKASSAATQHNEIAAACRAGRSVDPPE